MNRYIVEHYVRFDIYERFCFPFWWDTVENNKIVNQDPGILFRNSFEIT